MHYKTVQRYFSFTHIKQQHELMIKTHVLWAKNLEPLHQITFHKFNITFSPTSVKSWWNLVDNLRRCQCCAEICFQPFTSSQHTVEHVGWNSMTSVQLYFVTQASSNIETWNEHENKCCDIRNYVNALFTMATLPSETAVVYLAEGKWTRKTAWRKTTSRKMLFPPGKMYHHNSSIT